MCSKRQVFGHDKVAVLEGGLPAWKAAGLPTEGAAVDDSAIGAATAAAKAPAGTIKYKASLQRDKVGAAGSSQLHLAGFLSAM